MKNKPRYQISYFTDNELRFSSYLFTGLYNLAHEGIIDYTYKIPQNQFHVKEILCSRIEVTNIDTGFKKRIAFDWADSPRTIYKNKLDTCDVYYKRNYIPDISQNYCPSDQLIKLRPLGWVINCAPSKKRPLWVRLLGASYNFENKKNNLKNIPYTLKKMIVNMNMGLLHEDAFAPTTHTREDIILFQTRAYDPQNPGNTHDSGEITLERAGIIKALRNEFGAKTKAGFVPSPYACKAYPDLVVYDHVEQKEYLELEKKASICIYSRGLNDSPALKLGEYLAAGKCIVSPSIPTLLPKPLINNLHLLYFSSLEELIVNCKKLLHSPEKRMELERMARDYYIKEVSPASRLLTILRDELG